MEASSITGAELSDALKTGSLRNVIAGVVKDSATEGRVSFSMTNGRDWTDIPTEFIEKAERLETGLSGVEYPVVRITLAQPKSDEGRVLLELLLSTMSNLSKHVDAVQDLGPGTTTIARDDEPPSGKSPTGQWCCVRGKAYACGCYPDGGLLICCSEWEPCTTMGPRAVGTLMG